jgi:hypothetical protein
MNMQTDCYVARNTARGSGNAIHDEGARDYGFADGLVPGITLLAYAAESIRRAMGSDWVRRGYVHLSYRKPIYDGEEIAVMIGERPSNVAIEVRSAGALCCAGRATIGEALYTGSRPSLVIQPLPQPRVVMSGQGLLGTEALGSIPSVASVARVCAEFESYGVDPSWYVRHDTVPLAYLALTYHDLADANFVRLGPSILAGNEFLIIRPVSFDEPLTIRARVDRLFMRSGRCYATFEVGWFDEQDHPCVWAMHTSIYSTPAHSAPQNG